MRYLAIPMAIAAVIAATIEATEVVAAVTTIAMIMTIRATAAIAVAEIVIDPALNWPPCRKAGRFFILTNKSFRGV